MMSSTPWAFQSGFDATFIVIMCFTQLTFVASFVVHRITNNKHWGFALHASSQSVLIIYELVLKALRMHYLVGVEYEAVSKNGTFVGWRVPGNGTACTIEDMRNASDLTVAQGEAFNNWWVPDDRPALHSTYMRITVGYQLALYVVLSLGTIALEYAADRYHTKNKQRQRRIRCQFGIAFLACLIEYQQFCVLLPLTSVTYGGSGCIALDVPLDPGKALWLFTWAATLAYGIGLGLLAALFGYAAWIVSNQKPSSVWCLLRCDGGLASRLLSVLALLLGVPAVASVAVWFVGGAGIGSWFFFTVQLGHVSPLVIVKLLRPIEKLFAALRICILEENKPKASHEPHA